MNRALADLETPVADAVSAVALAAHVAQAATDDRHIGLLVYATFEADRKLAALKAEFDRLLHGIPSAVNDNAPSQEAAA